MLIMENKPLQIFPNHKTILIVKTNYIKNKCNNYNNKVQQLIITIKRKYP